eukprot:1391631-Prorocentrum_lima.AAC.1
MRACPRLRGGSSQTSTLPPLEPPADLIVHHLGGAPAGWHIRPLPVPDGHGAHISKHLLLPS